MMESKLKDDIKFNCDVSDARYWGFFSICGLLLRYRDLYRSEHRLKAWSNIRREDIGAWIQAKEARWPELEQKEFRDIVIEGKTYSPFDVEGINQALAGRGLVYGAGYGMYMKPTFFAAELKSRRTSSGLTVHISGTELVRDLFTAPAMLQGNTIFLRLEPLLMLLHFKYAELASRQNAALENAFTRYGFGQRQLIDDTFEKRLESMAADYAEVILLHEIAEHREGVPEWKDILTASGDRKNEHYLRAIKDLIADTSRSGPISGITEARNAAALGLSVALLDGFHRLLYPQIREAYAQFALTGDWSVIEQARSDGYSRFVQERERIVALYRSSSGRDDFSERLRKSI